MSGSMAMFPLGTVLLPGSLLPLHIFEPRYRRMMDDCLAARQEFGVVLITRGREVGGGDTRASVATVARIVQHTEFDDGRRAVMAAGVRRVRIDEWLLDDPYPQAVVSEWPDDGVPVASERVEHVHQRVRRTLALAVELGDSTLDTNPEFTTDSPFASYHLAAMAPFGPHDQLKLLSITGDGARLDALQDLLADVDAALRFRLGLPLESDG